MFGNLMVIVEKGIEPSNGEYILKQSIERNFLTEKYYLSDKDESSVAGDIPEGTVVIDVREDKERGGYFFTVKETGKYGHTNYPWMLVENTPANRQRLEAYYRLRKRSMAMKMLLDYYSKCLDTLNPPEPDNVRTSMQLVQYCLENKLYDALYEYISLLDVDSHINELKAVVAMITLVEEDKIVAERIRIMGVIKEKMNRRNIPHSLG